MNLLKSASIVSLLTLASRVTGLVREQLVAAAFGASAATDAFNVAFRLPNLFRRLFAEGAFSQAFVPVLAATRAAEGDEVTRRLVDAVATVLTWTLIAVCALGVVGAPILVWLMASGLERFDTAVLLTRFMFPYIGFMSLVALSAGILNTWKRFALPAATPVLLNLSFIVAAWQGAPWFERMGLDPILALAAGVMLGGVLQLAVQWPALRRVGCLPRIGMGPRAVHDAWRHPGVQRVLRQMAPALLGVSVAQISLLINTQIASHVGVGAVSWLTYADRLMEFPTALLGVALGTVLLPSLSQASGQHNEARYSALLDWGMRLVLVLAVPCTIGMALMAEPLTALLFHYGRFRPIDVQMTQQAIQAYAVGLPALIAIKVLAPGFFARQNIRTPVLIALLALVTTQLLNLVLVPWLAHAGLALATSLAALLNAGLLMAGLLRARTWRPGVGWLRLGAQVSAAAVLLTALLAVCVPRIDWIGLGTQPLLRAGYALGLIGAGAVLYLVVLLACGLRPAHFLRRNQ